MPERTMFYWAKMYTMQINPGDTYDKLKKCITINILDFECIPVKKIHTTYHLAEDETGHKLTDILEVHFVELPKLLDKEIVKDENEAIVQWMEFIDAKSKGVMEMLAKKNNDIKKAYDILQIISKDEKARMAYEAREAEVRDQLIRIKSAREKGIEEGIEKGIEKGETEKAIKVAKNLLKMGISIKQVAEATEIAVEKVEEIRKEISN